MSYSLHVKIPDSYSQLSSIENNLLLAEPSLRTENFVQLAAPHKRHNEVESQFILEEVLHTNQEWVIALEHDVFF